MYRKILVGYDGSDEAKDALTLGRQLAGATGAELVVAGVFQFDPMWGGRDYHFRDADNEFAEEVAEAADSANATAKTVASSSPARGLHELAETIDADLILVGSATHGRVGQVVAGSTGTALLHGSPCAVGVAPKGYREHAGEAFTTIAVGVDGSPEAAQAQAAATELASSTHATLKLVTVSDAPPLAVGAKGGSAGWHELKEAIDEKMRGRLTEARELVPEGIDADATFISGDPSEGLADVAKSPGTLLLVGSRGYGPLRRVLLGSVSTDLMRSAPSPLLITPRGAHTSEDAPAGAKAKAMS